MVALSAKLTPHGARRKVDTAIRALANRRELDMNAPQASPPPQRTLPLPELYPSCS